jgi:hypothetical protein
LTVLSFSAQLYLFDVLGRWSNGLPDDVDEESHVSVEAIGALFTFGRGWSLIGAGVAFAGFVGILIVSRLPLPLLILVSHWIP